MCDLENVTLAVDTLFAFTGRAMETRQDHRPEADGLYHLSVLLKRELERVYDAIRKDTNEIIDRLAKSEDGRK